MLLTSGYNFEGYIIKEYLGFYSGECALGTGFLSSFGAGLADILGSNSTMYEGKLSRAKSMAISDLQSKAINCGANAIIGLDVDYTTFTADIMGVIANGTAVKVERIPGHEISSQNTDAPENDTFTFPVISYYNILKIRPVYCLYNQKAKEFSIDIFSYDNVKPEAINVDIIANTIFDTSYTYHDINFVGFYTHDGIIKTENIFLDICENHLKVIKSFSVKINYCIIAGKILKQTEPYELSNMEINTLLGFRKSYGEDVMGDFREEYDYWICMCGNKNNDNNNTCACCGRTNRVYSKIKLSWESVLKEILPDISDDLNNCKEIYEYLEKIENDKNVTFSEKLMQELKIIISMERMYGNMKGTAIAKIKEYIS